MTAPTSLNITEWIDQLKELRENGSRDGSVTAGINLTIFMLEGLCLSLVNSGEYETDSGSEGHASHLATGE